MNAFIKATLIRAARTVCQTAIATIGSAFVVTEVNWLVVVSASFLAGILSILNSVATGLPEADYDAYLRMDAEEPDDAEVTGEEEDDDYELDLTFDEEGDEDDN